MSTATQDTSASYITRQRSRDADYRREYHAWVHSLPPEERSKLADMGLEEPDVADSQLGGHCDAADLPRCATLPEEPDRGEDTGPPSGNTQSADSDLLLDALRRILGEIIGKRDSALSVECLALVTGVVYDGDSMSEIARRHGVTRAAVSRRCVELSHALNLKPGRAMRPLKTRMRSRDSRIHHLRTHHP